MTGVTSFDTGNARAKQMSDVTLARVLRGFRQLHQQQREAARIAQLALEGDTGAATEQRGGGVL